MVEVASFASPRVRTRYWNMSEKLKIVGYSYDITYRITCAVPVFGGEVLTLEAV
jgi:hypothetical protein